MATACSATGGGSSPSGAAGGTGGTLEGTHWKLTTFDAGGTSTTVPAGVIVDARFTANTIAGSGGCNVYTGPATVSGATIKVGDLVSTQMACVGPPADVERAYLANLAKAATFTATADCPDNVRRGRRGDPRLRGRAREPPRGRLERDRLQQGKQAVVSPITGTTLTATFTADTVSGSAGCNDYNGSYTLDGDKVTIGPLATTRKACEQPVMDQETAFLTALQTPATVEQNGGIVTLRNADGATQVTLVTR